MLHAVDEIEESPTTRVDIVCTGPPDGGDGSDTECADEDDIYPEMLPNEVAGEGTSHEENIEPDTSHYASSVPFGKMIFPKSSKISIKL